MAKARQRKGTPVVKHVQWHQKVQKRKSYPAVITLVGTKLEGRQAHKERSQSCTCIQDSLHNPAPSMRSFTFCCQWTCLNTVPLRSLAFAIPLLRTSHHLCCCIFFLEQHVDTNNPAPLLRSHPLHNPGVSSTCTIFTRRAHCPSRCPLTQVAVLRHARLYHLCNFARIHTGRAIVWCVLSPSYIPAHPIVDADH